MIKEIELDSKEQGIIRASLREVSRSLDLTEEDPLLQRSATFSHVVPERVRTAFHDLKHHEAFHALLVRNNPLVAREIGPTPRRHWRPGDVRALNDLQVLHAIYASLLGEAFGFETQQRGRVFNDLICIEGAASNSSSGEGRIGLHTEDYSDTQPFMPDYLGLMCLRNEQHARTTISYLGKSDLCGGDLQILSRDLPYRRAPKRPMLFGDMRDPYIRYSSVDVSKCSEQTLAALAHLSAALDANKVSLELRQGDCIYIDNFRAVHGRDAFAGDYGENARWFSRLCILRDLRQTRHLRHTITSRVLLKNRTDAEAVRLGVPGFDTLSS